MIEFAVVLLVKRIIGFNQNQMAASKRQRSRTNNQVCFYKRNSNNRILGTNSGGKNPLGTKSVDTNTSYDLKNVQLPICQEGRYSVTDTIDFSALFVFMLSYIMFNSAYMYHYI